MVVSQWKIRDSNVREPSILPQCPKSEQDRSQVSQWKRCYLSTRSLLVATRGHIVCWRSLVAYYFLRLGDEQETWKWLEFPTSLHQLHFTDFT